MENSEMLEKLAGLVQLDIDALHAYEQAIRHIGDDDDIRGRFREFMDDHRSHVETLSVIVRERGGEPPESPDLKGYLITGFTALRSVTGTKGALEAMENNEKLTTARYEEATHWDIPSGIMKVINTNYAHEQRHLGYIQMILKTPRREL